MKNPHTTGLHKVARAWDEGFEAGLRRAQELAHKLRAKRGGPTVYVEELDQAIDAEAAKGRGDAP